MPLSAKISDVVCSCGHHFRACFLASDGWVKPCPECKQEVGVDSRTSKPSFNGNRRFAGEESISVKYGFNPDEVQAARKNFEDIPGVKILGNGDVQLDDRNASRRFADRYEAMDRVAGE